MLVRSKTKAVSELKQVPTHLLTTFYTIIKQNERNKLNKIEEKLWNTLRNYSNNGHLHADF